MNSFDTMAAVGMLTDGSFGIAHSLSISCKSEAEMDNNWLILCLCQYWRIKVGYKANSALLTLMGWGDPVPLMQPVDGRRLCIVPEYAAEWTMDDPDAVRFFMAGCKRHGYFALLPALRMKADETRRPILAFLKIRKGDVS